MRTNILGQWLTSGHSCVKFYSEGAARRVSSCLLLVVMVSVAVYFLIYIQLLDGLYQSALGISVLAEPLSRNPPEGGPQREFTLSEEAKELISPKIVSEKVRHLKKDLVGKYEPKWESLDKRPIPQWYPDAKLGIFLHWGLFSVPSVGDAAEQFWGNWLSGGDMQKEVLKREYMSEHYPPKFKFQDFAPEFKAEFYNPKEWAELFASSGAKYVVLTSKHHDGYLMWPSKHSPQWNCNDTGPGRDLVGELQQAINTTTNLHFGLYVSLLEWYHPKYLEDMKNQFRTKTFVNEKLLPEIIEMVERYHPEVIFADGDWNPGIASYWRSQEFLAWLFNHSPVKDTVVVNDRWGTSETWCKHGSYFNCGDKSNKGVVRSFPWENAMTIDVSSWGYRRDSKLERYLSIERLLKEFIQTISCGGNMLMNVGPTSSGTIAPIYEERLRQMGKWLRVNGEAVYGSRSWHAAQNDSAAEGVWYTQKGENVYAFFQKWPVDDKIVLGSPQPSPQTKVTMLGVKDMTFTWSDKNGQGMIINIPPISIDKLPCLWAWTLKLQGLKNLR